MTEKSRIRDVDNILRQQSDDNRITYLPDVFSRIVDRIDVFKFLIRADTQACPYIFN